MSISEKLTNGVSAAAMLANVAGTTLPAVTPTTLAATATTIAATTMMADKAEACGVVPVAVTLVGRGAIGLPISAPLGCSASFTTATSTHSTAVAGGISTAGTLFAVGAVACFIDATAELGGVCDRVVTFLNDHSVQTGMLRLTSPCANTGQGLRNVVLSSYTKRDIKKDDLVTRQITDYKGEARDKIFYKDPKTGVEKPVLDSNIDSNGFGTATVLEHEHIMARSLSTAEVKAFYARVAGGATSQDLGTVRFIDPAAHAVGDDILEIDVSVKGFQKRIGADVSWRASPKPHEQVIVEVLDKFSLAMYGKPTELVVAGKGNKPVSAIRLGGTGWTTTYKQKI